MARSAAAVGIGRLPSMTCLTICLSGNPSPIFFELMRSAPKVRGLGACAARLSSLEPEAAALAFFFAISWGTAQARLNPRRNSSKLRRADAMPGMTLLQYEPLRQ